MNSKYSKKLYAHKIICKKINNLDHKIYKNFFFAVVKQKKKKRLNYWEAADDEAGDDSAFCGCACCSFSLSFCCCCLNILFTIRLALQLIDPAPLNTLTEYVPESFCLVLLINKVNSPVLKFVFIY